MRGFCFRHVTLLVNEHRVTDADLVCPIGDGGGGGGGGDDGDRGDGGGDAKPSRGKLTPFEIQAVADKETYDKFLYR
jgi:hypothetical protein